MHIESGLLRLFDNGLKQLDVLQGGVHDVGVCLRNLAFSQLAEDLRRIDILLRLAGLTRQQVGDDDMSGGLDKTAGVEILEAAKLLVPRFDAGDHLREFRGQLLQLRNDGLHGLAAP